MDSDENQKVCREVVDRLKKHGFYSGKKSSFEKAIIKLLSFYEYIEKNNKKIYGQWIKKTNQK